MNRKYSQKAEFKKFGKMAFITMTFLCLNEKFSRADLRVFLTDTPEIEHSYAEIGKAGMFGGNRLGPLQLNIQKENPFSFYVKSDLDPVANYSFGRDLKGFLIGPSGLPTNFTRQGKNQFGYLKVTYSPSPSPSARSGSFASFSWNNDTLKGVTYKDWYGEMRPRQSLNIRYSIGSNPSSKADDYVTAPGGCALRVHDRGDTLGASQLTTAVSVPANFTAVATTSFSEQLRWTPVNGANAYRVRIYTSDSMSGESLVDEFKVSTTCVNVNDLDGGYIYQGLKYYWASVTAIGNLDPALSGTSETYAAHVMFGTQICSTREHSIRDSIGSYSVTRAVSSPVGLVAVDVDSSTETISWQPTAKATSYRIQIFNRDSMGGNFLIDEFLVPTTCVNVKRLDDGFVSGGSRKYWAAITAVGNLDSRISGLQETVATILEFGKAIPTF